MEEDLGTLNDLIENGSYEKIISWLKNNIYLHGRSLNGMELVEKISKQELSSDFFIDYLEDKIRDLS